MSIINMPRYTHHRHWIPVAIIQDCAAVCVHKGPRHLWVASGDPTCGMRRRLFKLYDDALINMDAPAQTVGLQCPVNDASNPLY